VFGNQPVLEHPLDRAVESSGVEAELAFRTDGHLLHDGVAVPLALGERTYDVKAGLRQRQKVLGVHRPDVYQNSIDRAR